LLELGAESKVRVTKTRIVIKCAVYPLLFEMTISATKNRTGHFQDKLPLRTMK